MRMVKWSLLALGVLFIVFLGGLIGGLADSSYRSHIGIEVEDALERPFTLLGFDAESARRSLSAPGELDPDRICLAYPRTDKKIFASGGVGYTPHPGDPDLGMIDLLDWPEQAFVAAPAGDLDSWQCSDRAWSYGFVSNVFLFSNFVMYAERYVLTDSAIATLSSDRDFFEKFFAEDNEDDPDNFVAKMNDAYPDISPFRVKYRIEGNVFAFQLVGTRPAFVNFYILFGVLLAFGAVLPPLVRWVANRRTKMQGRIQ
jgi:hypothetical protein